tara:strand:+ start:127 stop:678 length:552 start_codon:yes stop_codon:yes gene_type:complete
MTGNARPMLLRIADEVAVTTETEPQTMTTKIDRNLMKAIREPIETALAQVATKFEIEIKLGRGTYSEGDNGKFNLELNAIDETGVVQTKEAAAYKTLSGVKWGDLEAFDPDWLFKEFKYARETFKLVGFKTRARKNNMLIHRVKTDTQHVAPSKDVLRALEKQYGVFKTPEAGGLIETAFPGS